MHTGDSRRHARQACASTACRGLLLGAGLAVLLAALGAPAASGAALRPVDVKTEAAYDPLQPVRLTFRPAGRLPHHGYYYAVAVVGPTTGREKCALSSDMARTPYGYPHGRRRITLTLYPAAEAAWCAGVTYEAAVYAVPHAPRCAATGGCAGRSAQCGGAYEPCPFDGVLPETVGRLPKPIDRSSRIVARLQLRFPAGPPSVPAEAMPGLLARAEQTARLDGDPAPADIEAVRTSLKEAGRVLSGESFSAPFASEQIYLVAERGHFVCNLCHPPSGAKAPTGSVITLEEPLPGGGLSGFGMSQRYPNLGLLGDPVSLGG